ncbi:MAG: ketosynthase [Pseudomonadota bacterium]|nr:ketosynthase [Pseudomonadota bacterium]
MILLVRAVLAVAYAVLAHQASARQDNLLAALAIVVLVALVLLAPLLQGRIAAWLGLVAGALGAAWLMQTPYVQAPLLLVPFVFIMLVAWWFARSLKPGRVPLISKIVAALEKSTADELTPDLRHYTRALTAAWAVLLAAIAVSNITLAMIATPAGLLAQFGVQPAVTVSQAQWSWFANFLDYGIMGSFMLAEYLYRKRRFPGRYKNFADFARRLAGLGPVFWRDFLH